MSNNSTKAVIATIDLGFTKIDGLMLPDGSYAIAVPQLAELKLVPPNRSLKQLETLSSMVFQSHQKVKTDLNPKPVNVISLSDFSRLIRNLDKQNNLIARGFVDALLEEGLERRFDHAFNKYVEEEERNNRIALRIKRLQSRKLWTDVLRDRYLSLYNQKPSAEEYKKWAVMVNERLFQKTHFQCNRDTMKMWEQETIELFERMAQKKAKTHPEATPEEIVNIALQSFE